AVAVPVVDKEVAIIGKVVAAGEGVNPVGAAHVPVRDDPGVSAHGQDHAVLERLDLWSKRTGTATRGVGSCRRLVEPLQKPWHGELLCCFAACGDGKDTCS